MHFESYPTCAINLPYIVCVIFQNKSLTCCCMVQTTVCMFVWCFLPINLFTLVSELLAKREPLLLKFAKWFGKKHSMTYKATEHFFAIFLSYSITKRFKGFWKSCVSLFACNIGYNKLSKKIETLRKENDTICGRCLCVTETSHYFHIGESLVTTALFKVFLEYQPAN